MPNKSGWQTVTFPISFSVQCLTAYMTTVADAEVSDRNSLYRYYPIMTAPKTSEARMFLEGASRIILMGI